MADITQATCITHTLPVAPFDPAQTIWFDEPAAAWTEALPVGNGRLGGMVFGGTTSETISFNEDTLWTGQPHDSTNAGAHEVLEDLRKLLHAGKQEEAHVLGNSRFMAKPLGQQAYQPFGKILLEFPGHEPTVEYQRCLDLAHGVATVSYRVKETCYRREILASHPGQVLLVHLTAESGTLDFSIRLEGDQSGHDTRVEDGEIVLTGKVNDYEKDRQRGTTPYPKSALRYEARLRVLTSEGKVVPDADSLRITGATEVTLQLVAATNFVNYRDISADPHTRCLEALEGLAGRSYDDLKKAHIADYQSLYQRVSLDLGDSDLSRRPTDERVASFPSDRDPALVALVFQYGRYLLISSSRPGSQPANLQGIWNDRRLPPWDSKYTTNINVEMNYWPAEVANLPELVQPLIRMVEELSETGRKVAREHYNLPGWVAHHNTDLWRGAAPINHANHGIWVTGGAWLCQHLWWHYQFNGNREFLEHTAYPIMKEAARFFAEYLVPAENQPEWWISGPSNSPETGGLVMGPTMDHQIIRSLFAHTIEAAEILDVDRELVCQLKELTARIAPNQIGRHGQLQEWLEDRDDPACNHRHISHLWGLHPGDEIHPRITPAWADACRVTLGHRGFQVDGGGLGWSAAWKINTYARLLDGEAAFASLEALICPNPPGQRPDGPRNHINIFDANPPFQIEQNFGATSGIAEMFLQSQLRDRDGSYFQDLLPALPAALPSGTVSGIKGRGGFEWIIRWEQGELVSAQAKSLLGNPLNIRYRGGTLRTPTKTGKTYAYSVHDFS